ncbi:SidA/IucD/PvdA family monooxygenase [Mycobacterium sp. SM1]|uniref:SidA/IucD/PvdA family monooxygenase n=1 Tax=Mycobacterium sp. SM1 TaxID=2816243 RepID=UPI001BD0F580|nr:SidA/IucD/PvdA family monooxygenase [Mycobacterium sp. SM1]MBS4729808.1 SidA/IucD/PvdA family monooxygenase [Mycobacterium sp. SM1]
MTPVPASAQTDSGIDFIGIGFGPSNLALAVAADEIVPSCRGLFLERSPSFQWHPGMMLDGAKMQISFLKDLATLRNPASQYTFLQYTKAKGRLEQFVNLNEFRPSRLEYHDYLQWVAAFFADRVRYGTVVTAVAPVRESASTTAPMTLFKVYAREVTTGAESCFLTRNVVYSGGGVPRLSGQHAATSAVLHSSEFWPHFANRFNESQKAYRFAVVGNGQSAAEIVEYLLNHYPLATLHLFIPDHTLRAADSSPFINEHFFSASAAEFYDYSLAKRSAVREELRPTNYGVVDPDLLQKLYETAYLDQVKGCRRLHLHCESRLTQVREVDNRVVARFADRFSGESSEFHFDGAVLATGYDRRLDAEIFREVLPYILRDESGAISLSRSCRVNTAPAVTAGLFVQGYGEASFGIGDTLLSLLPFRAQAIIEEIATNRRGAPTCRRRNTHGEYPPKRYVETDLDRLRAVINRYRFATLISARGVDEPVVTQLPLTLDTSRGPLGVLFGHMDVANPHTELLDGHRVLVLFHGPNGYISPHVYESPQLPTWNSIAVEVRGRARILRDKDAVVNGLCGIAVAADPSPGGYRLTREAASDDRLFPFIVGFEIDIEEMTGRFKLSQDRDDKDRWLAARALAQGMQQDDRDLISSIVGFRLDVDDGPIPLPQERST